MPKPKSLATKTQSKEPVQYRDYFFLMIKAWGWSEEFCNLFPSSVTDSMWLFKRGCMLSSRRCLPHFPYDWNNSKTEALHRWGCEWPKDRTCVKHTDTLQQETATEKTNVTLISSHALWLMSGKAVKPAGYHGIHMHLHCSDRSIRNTPHSRGVIRAVPSRDGWGSPTIRFLPCWSLPTSTLSAHPGSGMLACRHSSTVCQSLPSCWRHSWRPRSPAHGGTGSWNPAGTHWPTHRYPHNYRDRSNSHCTGPMPRSPGAGTHREGKCPSWRCSWLRSAPLVRWAGPFILPLTFGFQMLCFQIQVQCVIA